MIEGESGKAYLVTEKEKNLKKIYVSLVEANLI